MSEPLSVSPETVLVMGCDGLAAPPFLVLTRAEFAVGFGRRERQVSINRPIRQRGFVHGGLLSDPAMRHDGVDKSCAVAQAVIATLPPATPA